MGRRHNKAYQTATTRIRLGTLAQAVEALELAGKNLRNTGAFGVKNVRSSFRKNEAGVYELKADRHANPKQAVAETEREIDACNARRRGKSAARKAKFDALEKLHTEGLSEKSLRNFLWERSTHNSKHSFVKSFVHGFYDSGNRTNNLTGFVIVCGRPV